MTRPRRVIVIGAGVAGLFAAVRLARRGLQPVVLDRAPRPGGLLAWARVGATDLELFYHHLFTNDRLTQDTLRRLDVPIDWRVTRTGFVRPDGGVAEFSGPQHLLGFDLLAPGDRLRLGAALVRISLEWARQRDVAALDDIPARDWMATWGGARVYDRFFAPLLAKKYGRLTPTVSAAFLVGRLGMRAGRTWEGERLGYPRGGFRSVVHALVAELRRAGGELRLGAAVDRLTVENGRVTGVALAAPAEGEPARLAADAVVLTPQPRAQAPLLERSGLPAEAARMTRLPYQGAFTVLLGLERGLTDFYWLNVVDPAAPFGAVIEHTRFQPAALYEGPTVYLASYPDAGDPLWERDDDAVVDHFVAHLRRVLPAARDNPVRWSRVARTDEASLVYRCGVADLLPRRRAATPGLYYTGMFRAYPKRPIDLVGADACGCADTVAADLRGVPAPPDGWRPTRIDP